MTSSPFSRERLVHAREAAGLPVTALARLVDMTRQTITNYENGVTEPSYDVVGKLASVLQEDTDFFYLPPPAVAYEHERVYFRDNSRNRKLDQHAAGRLLETVQEYVYLLSQFVDLPDCVFPTWDPPENPMLISDSAIEAAANSLREAWDLGDRPLRNLVRVAELNGVIVQTLPVGCDNLDGLSMWSSELGRPIVVLNDFKQSCVRSRFDMAHELGHAMLHRNVPPHIRTDQAMYKRLEAQAHHFASSLLLPAESWGNEVGRPTIGTFLSLKPRWLVSISAQARRARTLGLITDDRYTQLMKQLSSKRWRTTEPLDKELPQEVPVLLKRATELLATDSPRRLESLLSRMRRRPATLARVAGVPTQFFESSQRVFGLAARQHPPTGLLN